MCVREETAVVGGPRDRGFREESPLRLAGFITVRASPGKPTHRRKYRHTWTHMHLVFMGSELRSPHHILSYSSQKSNPIFPHHLLYTVSFFAPSLSNSPVLFFSHSHLPSISLSHSPRLSLGRPPFRQRGVCQVPNPWAERSKADKETGDLLFYSGKAKMESLIDRDIAFFPLFSPSSSFTHSILLSGFSLFFFPFVGLSPAPSPSLLSVS